MMNLCNVLLVLKYDIAITSIGKVGVHAKSHALVLIFFPIFPPPLEFFSLLTNKCLVAFL